ncbi:MAG TPA: 16S rRNA (guanine(966)-N(2))-methyltransferase RsmD [Desulfobacteraceae bacterium]|nr:16S rRNA (guanine(966)-N(2))-methyltransferase RsmD [Desulfobacteraceae bacterium]
MRIIGGNLKKKKLNSISGLKIRPTADRLRESIFNIISVRIKDAVVLDLFAGTGAMGIEALSRGAKLSVFIDHYRTALSVIERNIRACSLKKSAKIIRWDIIKNLNCIKSADFSFDLVFIDPPYARNLVKQALLNLQRSRCLDKKALIIVEHSILEPVPEHILTFKRTYQKKYGKTMVSYLSLTRTCSDRNHKDPGMIA